MQSRYSLDDIRAIFETGHTRQAFGLAWMQTYLPHYLTCQPSQLHLDFAEALSALHSQRGSWRNYIAPRGSAKTTWMTKGYGLYCALEGIEPYILILSDTGPQAESFLEAIRDEVETNPAIQRDYPHVAGVGPVWQSRQIVLRNGVIIVARGAGSRVRGLTKKQSRPSLVIVDDPNEKTDAHSPTTRGRKWDWFTKDVMPVGSPQTNFLVAGTPIHRDTICYRLKATAGWQTKSYRNLKRYPDRMDLWQEWERIATNLADEDRTHKADDFINVNREAMHAGAELLWPERFSLQQLMLYRAANGQPAFDSEYQDEPGGDGSSEWPSEYFDKPDFWFDQWPQTVNRIYALDPSKGSDSKSGDYQAHAKIGLTSDGTIWIECDLRREDVAAMAERAIVQAADFHCSKMIVEENGTMGFILPEFQNKMAKLKKLVPLETITNTESKMSRIRIAGPYLSRGKIRVRNTPGGRLLVAQWRDVPNGEYDDGPDAVATGIKRLQLLVNGKK